MTHERRTDLERGRGAGWFHGLALLLASAVLLAAVVHFVTTLAEVVS